MKDIVDVSKMLTDVKIYTYTGPLLSETYHLSVTCCWSYLMHHAHCGQM